MSYEIERLETDVLVVGGGLAGCTAALSAREKGAEVILLEAANTYRSGDAGSGLDHIYSYVPKVHERVGYTKDDMKKDMKMFCLQAQGFGYPKLGELFVDTSFERVHDKLSAVGISFDAGNRHLVDGIRLVPQFQSIPTSFNFPGRDIKVKLTEANGKAGVRIINRAEAVKVLRSSDGRAAGAVAVSTREDKIYAITAKTTVLATNRGLDRLTEEKVTTNRNNYRPSFTTNGAGFALAMRAGADVINLELGIRDDIVSFNGFAFTVGAPGGSWWPAGRIVDGSGNVIVERTKEYDIDEPDYVKKNQADYKKYNEQKQDMIRLLREGALLYMDLKEATEEEIEQIRFALRNEGTMNLWLDNLEREGIELRDVKIPLKYEKRTSIAGMEHGIYVDEHLETTLPNLYAAGDVLGAVISFPTASTAVVYGFEVGEQAAARAKQLPVPVWDERQLEEVVHTAESILDNKEGYAWDDVEREIRSIVGQFARCPMTDDRVQSGLRLLRRVREKHTFYADNPYDLTKCFEVLFLLDNAEALFTAAGYRTESLFTFRRIHDGKETQAAKKEVFGLHYDPSGALVHTVHENGFQEV